MPSSVEPEARLASVADDGPMQPAAPDALVRLAEAEDTLRAIGAGEVDAFVLSDEAGRRVFTLETADRPYRMFVENMRDGAATISSTGLILFANRRLGELLSCARDTIVGAPLSRFLPVDAPIGLDELSSRGVTVEVDLLDADGHTVPVLVGSTPLVVDNHAFTCLTFSDLRAQKAHEREIARLDRVQTERLAQLEEAQAALAYQASRDALTGLPYRAVLVDRIDQALASARRSGRCTAVFFVDVDRFKDVNDTQGHAAGDAALQRIAAQLAASVRPMDSVARMGGDEFALLAVEVDSHQHAIDIGNRMVSELSTLPRQNRDGELFSASVGISISDRGRGTAETLLHEADMAMYKAKGNGGGRSEVFDAALGLEAQQRANAKVALQSALDEGRAVAYYQPIINLAAGHVTGFEALVRITERDGSLVAPIAFIPAAEESGLVVPLGATVLAIACQEISRRRPQWTPLRPWNVAVNVSARQFEPGDLPAIVQRNLEAAELDPGRLHLELTETAIMSLGTSILKQLAQIRDLGVEVGLDDFGTGYASLTHLRQLPLSFVKIDQSFVQGITTDPEDEGIVSAVIGLAAQLGLRSIAEGVETPEQLQRLREFGCDEAQGYLFARPQPSIEEAMTVAAVPPVS
ncbi:MAG: putative signaling protein [Acidimicrobiales bacterium]|nr:putative signaling protein [Acidimicrobiales bacterium]